MQILYSTGIRRLAWLLPILTLLILALPGSVSAQTYLNESFEGTWSADPGAPSGWTQQEVRNYTVTTYQPWRKNTLTGTNTWSSTPYAFSTWPNTTSFPNYNATTNNSVAWIYDGNYGGAAYNSSTRLITPTIDLSSSTSPWVSFFVWDGNGITAQHLQVLVSTDNGTTWELLMPIASPGQATSSRPFAQYAVNLSQYKSATTKLAFGSINTFGSSDIWLDQIVLAERSATTNTFNPSTATGNWFTAASWSLGRVPNALDDVVIAAGKTANIDVLAGVPAVAASLSVEGTLQYSATSNYLIVGGDVTVVSGGTLRLGTSGTTGSRIYVGGDLVVNGTLNGTLGTGCALYFYGRNKQFTGSGTITSNIIREIYHAGTGTFTYNQTNAVAVQATFGLFNGNVNPNSKLNLGVNTFNLTTIKGFGNLTAAPGFPNIGTSTRSVTYQGPNASAVACYTPFGNVSNISAGGPELEVISGVKTVTGTLTFNHFGNFDLVAPVQVGNGSFTGTLTMTRGIVNSTSTNYLWLGPSCTGSSGTAATNLSTTFSSSATAGSYVSGPIRVAFNALATTRNLPFGFGTNLLSNTSPFGAANGLRPMVLSRASGNWASQDITVTPSTSASGSFTAPLAKLVSNKLWQITENTGTLDANTVVTLSVRNQSLSGGGDNLLATDSTSHLRVVQSTTGTGGWTSRSNALTKAAFTDNSAVTIATQAASPGPIAPLSTNGGYFAIAQTTSTIGTTTATTPVSTAVSAGQSDLNFLRIAVIYSPAGGTISLSGANITGTFTDGDVTDAKIWAGTVSGPTGASPLGTINNPSPGTIAFTGLSTTLAAGLNYFWVTYSMAATLNGTSAKADLLTGGLTFSTSAGAIAPTARPAADQLGTARLFAAPITITPATTTTFCVGGSVSLTASSVDSYTYTWSPATGLNTTSGGTVIASPTTTTTYTVSGVNGPNTVTKTQVVTVNQLPTTPTILGTPTGSVCVGSTVALSLGNLGSPSAGTGTTTSSAYGPLRGNWGGSRHQYLYTAAEVGAARNIAGLRFDVTAFSGSRATYTGYTIKVAHTSLTGLVSTFESPTWTTVYFNAAHPGATATGAYTINFNTPFAYNGTSNLLVEICYNDPDAGVGAVTFNCTSLAFIGSNTFSGDNNTGVCTNATGTTNALRPNTIFMSPQTFSTYVWSPSTGLSATNIANPVLTVPAAGANTYTLTGTDANGCVSAAGSITVTGLARPSAPSVEANPSHCGNKAPGTTFTYTTGAGVTLRIYATNSSTTPLETIASPGNKMTTYLVSNTTNLFASVVAANGCESSRTPFTVTVSEAPSITITPVGGSSICVGQSKVVNLTSTADYTYSWSPSTGVTAGTTAGNFILAPTTTTTYTVTGVDPDLCQNTQNITITVNALPNAPVIVASQTGSVCQGSPVSLSVPNFNTVLGTGTSASGTQGPMRSNWGAGRFQYLYRASDIGGPARLINAIAFNVSSFAGARPTFAGYTVKMANSAVTALTGTYQSPTWTNVYFNNAQPAPTATGSYVINFTTPFAWDGTSNVIIDICHNNPDAGNGTDVSFTNTTLAYNASTSAANDNAPTHCSVASGTASGTRPNTTFITTQSFSSYSWSPSTGLSATNVANPTLTVPSAGALAYTLTVTNANGCQNNSVFNVTGLAVPSAPTVTANPSHCGNKVPGVTFGSHLGDSIRIYATNSSTVVLERIAEPALNMSTYLVGTTTTLYAAVVGVNGCESARTPFTVNVLTAPTITVTPTTSTSICPGGSVEVTVSSPGDYTYTWSSPAQVTAGTTAGTYIITPSAAGTFIVTGVDPDLCENTASVNITFRAVPNAPVISSSAGLSVCQGSSTNLNVTDINTVLGTGTGSSGLQGPMRSNWGGSRHQYLYRASDIGGVARTIHAISFNVTGFSAARPTFTGYTIKMASTASTTLTAFESPTWTTVYTNANQPAPTATGAFTFNLATPFAWNGTSNVLIEVCYNDQDGGNGTDVTFSNTTLAYNGTISLSQDNNANVCTNTGTGTSTTRPNTTFITRQVFSSYSWSPADGLSATNIANPVLTLPNTGANVYTLTVTNALGCATSQPITLTGVTPPSVLSEATNVAHCGVQTPNVTINTVVGDTMFVYADEAMTTLLQKTRATATTTALAGFTMGAGTVYVAGKNPTTSCFGPALPVTISITPAPALTAGIQGAYDPCTQSTASVQLLASGTGYTTYTWTPSTGLSAANIANPVANPKGTTTYTVVASGAGCQNTTTVTVTRQLAPVATSSASSYGVLSGQPVTLTGVTRSNLVPDPILGNGTAPTTVATGVTVASPYATYWGANKQQYIIRASELRAAGYAAGAINGMWFTINSVGTEPNVQDFAVFMEHTSLTDLSTTSHPATTFTTPANLVYGPTTRTLAPNSSDTVRFTNSFNWNGVDNIIIQTCFDNDVFGTSNAGTLVVPTTYTSTMMGYGDNQGGSFCSNDFTIDVRQTNRPVFNFLQLPTSTTVTWTGPNGFTSTNRTLVINPTVSGTYTFRATGNGCTSTATPFNIDIVACPVPTGLASTGVTATTASFTHNLMFGITSYIVAYRRVGTTTWTTYYVNNGSFTIVGLAPSTSYEVNVRTFCNFASSSTASTNVVVTTGLANDVVSGALTLSVSNNFVPLTQDNTTATTGPEPAPTCQTNYSKDVWYKYTVPASGRVMIYANVGTLTRLNIQNFTGTPTNLVSNACVAGTAGTNARLFVTGQTPGTVNYVRISSFSANAGTFTIGIAEGHLWTGTTNTTYSTATNWYGGATPATSDVVVFRSSGNQPSVTASTTTAGIILQAGINLTVTTGTLTVNGPLSFAGNNTINLNTGGITATGAASLANATFTGSGTLSITGAVSASGATFNNTGTTTFTGATTLGSATLGATTTINLAGNAVFNNSSISGDGIIQFTGTSRTLSGSVLLENLQLAASASVATQTGAVVTIGTGLTLLASATFDNTLGSVILNSVNGKTANLTNLRSGATYTGNITQRAWLPTPTPTPVYGRWFNIGVGVKGHTLGSLGSEFYTRGFAGANDPTGNPTVRFYSEPDTSWKPATSASQALAPGVGPIVFLDHRFFGRRAYFTVTGPPVVGDGVNGTNTGGTEQFAFTLTRAGLGSNATKVGNNILANPFPSAIAWTSANWTRSANISPTIFIRDALTNQWLSYNFNTTSGTRGTGAAFGRIASGQAFAVVVNAAGTTTLSVAEQAKINATTSNAQREGSIVNPMTFKLSAAGVSNGMDVNQVGFMTGTTVGEDLAYDARKMMSGVIDMWMENGSAKQVVNFMERPTTTTTIPLNFRTVGTGAHTISFSDVAGLTGEGVTVMLMDNFTGTATYLTTDQDYTFSVSAAAASKADGRFSLILAPAGPTSVGTAIGKVVFGVYPNPTEANGDITVVLNNLAVNSSTATISINDAVGRTVLTEVVSFNGQQNSWTVKNQLAAGVYTVRATAGGETFSQKLVVK